MARKHGTLARPSGPDACKRCALARPAGPPVRKHAVVARPAGSRSPKTQHFGPTDRAQCSPFQPRCSNASAPPQPSPLQLQRLVSTASVPPQDRFGAAADFSATPAPLQHHFSTASAQLQHQLQHQLHHHFSTDSTPLQHRRSTASALSTASAYTAASAPLQHRFSTTIKVLSAGAEAVLKAAAVLQRC